MCIFRVKIQLLVTAKYDQSPDLHWFGSLDPDTYLGQVPGLVLQAKGK
jgi:hypothetical protein